MGREPVITFVVPVRHPANSTNWIGLCARLTQTVRSIAAQTHPSWRGVVVANHEADIPALPDGFSLVRVDFPPNRMHDFSSGTREAVLDAVRWDKGRRVLAGMLGSIPSKYFMVVDDDDFVSRELTGYVADRSEENGWIVKRGLIWSENSRFVYLHRDFARICGTSHIVRSDLFELPQTLETADESMIKQLLGSHVKVAPTLAARGAPLADLPFVGAVYRVGHAGAHSQQGGSLRRYLVNRTSLRSPLRAIQNLAGLRYLTAPLADQFGIAVASA